MRKLLFARRLQHLSSVISSLHLFWARVFILPKKIIRLLEHKFNCFLWCGSDVVSWDKICIPKKEGGLGIKNIEVWKQASILNHIWNLFAKAGSLWVAWVNIIWLKGRSVW